MADWVSQGSRKELRRRGDTMGGLPLEGNQGVGHEHRRDERPGGRDGCRHRGRRQGGSVRGTGRGCP